MIQNLYDMMEYTSSLQKRNIYNLLNKSENATLLLLVKMSEKGFFYSFHFLFCKIECLTSTLAQYMCFEHVKKNLNFHD